MNNNKNLVVLYIIFAVVFLNLIFSIIILNKNTGAQFSPVSDVGGTDYISPVSDIGETAYMCDVIYTVNGQKYLSHVPLFTGGPIEELSEELKQEVIDNLIDLCEDKITSLGGNNPKVILITNRVTRVVVYDP